MVRDIYCQFFKSESIYEIVQEIQMDQVLQKNAVSIQSFIKTRYKMAVMLWIHVAFFSFTKMMISLMQRSGDTRIPDEILNELRFDRNHPQVLIFSAMEMVLTMLAGRLAEKWSPKWILFISALVVNTGLFVLPVTAVASRYSIYFMYVIFTGMYIIRACFIPTTIVLLSRWAPPNERLVMAAVVYSGYPFGYSIACFLTTWLFSTLRWQSVLYGTAVIKILWMITWAVVVRDDPSKHNDMTETEKQFIFSSLEDELYEYKRKSKSSIPWKDMLCSSAFWAGAIIYVTAYYSVTLSYSQISRQISIFTENNPMLPLNQAVIVSMPIFWMVVLMWFFSLIAFNMVMQDVMALVDVYRLGFIVALIGTGLNVPCFYFHRYLDDYLVMLNSTLTLFLFGFFCTCWVLTLDMSPNYAGTIMGVYQALGILPELILNKVLTDVPNLVLIKTLFSTATVVVSGLVGLVYCSPDLQPWNNHSHLLKVDRLRQSLDSTNKSAQPATTTSINPSV